jgi:hypothetical protein
MTPTAQTALDRIIALKSHTGRSGMLTHRSHRAILRALTPEDLADVILALNAKDEPFESHSVLGATPKNAVAQ